MSFTEPTKRNRHKLDQLPVAAVPFRAVVSHLLQHVVSSTRGGRSLQGSRVAPPTARGVKYTRRSFTSGQSCRTSYSAWCQVHEAVVHFRAIAAHFFQRVMSTACRGCFLGNGAGALAILSGQFLPKFQYRNAPVFAHLSPLIKSAAKPKNVFPYSIS